jgi:hypothetical protein
LNFIANPRLVLYFIYYLYLHYSSVLTLYIYYRPDRDEDIYKDWSSFNKWLRQLKDQRVWVAEEVVRILHEFGAKPGERLPGHEPIGGPDFQHSVGSKRRRSDSQ